MVGRYTRGETAGRLYGISKSYLINLWSRDIKSC